MSTGRRGAGKRWRDESGSAIVDFALVGGLLTVLFAAVLQLGFALYVHNILVSCAAEGARYAARADRQPADALPQTRRLVSAELAARYAADITADREVRDGVVVVVVRIKAPLPVFGLLGPPRSMTATGHAFAEQQ